ncbi:erythropoietin isoform X2 [Haliaeetus albicilla]|uniref:erythropoietin isoform X2 n=1 Tax=Haliaeetus albicilla TaxID=8969 RepID=UPI0037E72D9C
MGAMGAVGLCALVLMLLGVPGRPDGPPSLCDRRVMERFILEARDAERGLASCGPPCDLPEAVAVPDPGVNFNDWQRMDVAGADPGPAAGGAQQLPPREGPALPRRRLSTMTDSCQSSIRTRTHTPPASFPASPHPADPPPGTLDVPAGD